MTKRIYVGNLSYSATEEEVRDMFSPHGEIVSVAMITDRETGRFRGFCFVEMEDAAADAAVEALNDLEVGGRALRVNEARPREERGGSQGGGQGGGYRDRGSSRW